MVRLSELVPAQRINLERLDCQEMPTPEIQPGRPLKECNVALISSAGLMQRHQPNVEGNSSDYRTISSDTADTDILLNHISVNFDRTGYAEDINCVLPRERLTELEKNGSIASAADEHYAFMGATAPQMMKQNVDRLIDELLQKNINTACLLPV